MATEDDIEEIHQNFLKEFQDTLHKKYFSEKNDFSNQDDEILNLYKELGSEIDEFNVSPFLFFFKYL